MKIRELIQKGKQKLEKNEIEDSLLISKILICYILKIEKNELIKIQEDEIKENDEILFNQYIEEIVLGKPVQYITNNQEFMKLSFYVDENVLIPQPDTEILVEEVIDIFEKIKKRNKKDTNNIKQNKDINLLDICTGSGAIGISLAKYLSDIKVTLSDISKNALEIAKKNAIKNNVYENIEFIESDMFKNIKEKYDFIVSNPPYIETEVIKTLDKQVQNEPMLALDGGQDGLDFYRILIKESEKYLNDNGYLCLEIGYDQKDKIIKLSQESKLFKNIYSKKDLSGNDRIVICEK